MLYVISSRITTLPIFITIYRRFGTIYRSHLQGPNSPGRMAWTLRCTVI